MLTRREFLISAGMAATGPTLSRQVSPLGSHIDGFIKGKMETTHIPGLVVSVVNNARIAQSKGYGWASIEQKVVMSPDTLMNIASVSKTVTATAVMQLWEKEKFKLDEDINRYLAFRVKNPSHPAEPITFRHLLTHTSSIKDGSAYYKSYACRDPTMPLRTWLKEYLTPEGVNYQKEDNFYDSKPGERFSYSNIGFGVLGYLVEMISGTSFSQFCKSNIFAPLDMKRTSWYIADLPLSKQAVPYAYVSNGKARGGLLQEHSSTKGNRDKEGYVPNCLYSFPNVSDGLVRTSVQQLAHFLLAYISNGTYEGNRILRDGTVREMLREQIAKSKLADWMEIQGLAWYARRLRGGDLVWGHGGADPGISTLMLFRPSDRVGIILFANTGGVGEELQEIAEHFFRDSAR